MPCHLKRSSATMRHKMPGQQNHLTMLPVIDAPDLVSAFVNSLSARDRNHAWKFNCTCDVENATHLQEQSISQSGGSVLRLKLQLPTRKATLMNDQKRHQRLDDHNKTAKALRRHEMCLEHPKFADQIAGIMHESVIVAKCKKCADL